MLRKEGWACVKSLSKLFHLVQTIFLLQTWLVRLKSSSPWINIDLGSVLQTVLPWGNDQEVTLDQESSQGLRKTSAGFVWESQIYLSNLRHPGNCFCFSRMAQMIDAFGPMWSLYSSWHVPWPCLLPSHRSPVPAFGFTEFVLNHCSNVFYFPHYSWSSHLLTLCLVSLFLSLPRHEELHAWCFFLSPDLSLGPLTMICPHLIDSIGINHSQ